MAKKANVSHTACWALLTLALWLGFSLSVSAHVKSRSRPSEEVDALFKKWSGDLTPGAAVMVIQNGKVVHRKGYGRAVLKEGTTASTPIIHDTNFRLASLSKQFTAMAIMILAERGMLSYDDHLSKFFPQFSPEAGMITIRQLLRHTSGLPDHEKLFLEEGKISYNWPRSARIPPDIYEPSSGDALEILTRQKQLNFSPDTKFEYSNSGYVVLGELIHKVSGQCYGQFLKKEIFKKLGMHNTVVSDGKDLSVPNLAKSYTQKSGIYCDIDYTPLNRIVGDDGVFSSLDDLEKWIRALKSEKLVTSKTLQLAFTPGRLENGKCVKYGFGWYLGRRLRSKVIEHDGVWVGFRNFILDFPQRKLTIVVLANFDEIPAEELAVKVAQIYLKK